MSAVKVAKNSGFKDLSEVIALSGIARSTLKDWFIKKPDLFKSILLGCAIRRVEEAAKEIGKLD